MPCYSPLQAWQTGGGDVIFVERMSRDVRRELSLPCGQCIGCRLERSRQWAMRCVHESTLHSANSFITLTYDTNALPRRGLLQYPDFQRFLKRLRKRVDIRYYMCGEYGELNWRPHYHACIFGYDFPDKEFLTTLGSGSAVYRSAELERLWPHGQCSVGDVTFESAGYCARYCVQKVTGKNAKYHYARSDADGDYELVPEFNHMSLKPGIGSEFYRKWRADMYPHDYVVVRGQKMKPPKYYDRLFAKDVPEEWEDLQFKRELDGRSNWEDNVPERLYAKRVVTEARATMLKRSME